MTEKSVKKRAHVVHGFDPVIADEIIERMTLGENLTKICADPKMPGRVTVYGWMDGQPEFRTRYARAREALADFLVDQIERMADATTEENVNSMKVKISTAQWRAMKMAPRSYGDKTQTEVTGAGGGPVQLAAVDLRGLSDAELATMQTLLGKASDPT